jgi:hypothetical protein
MKLPIILGAFIALSLSSSFASQAGAEPAPVPAPEASAPESAPEAAMPGDKMEPKGMMRKEMAPGRKPVTRSKSAPAHPAAHMHGGKHHHKGHKHHWNWNRYGDRYPYHYASEWDAPYDEVVVHRDGTPCCCSHEEHSRVAGPYVEPGEPAPGR